jgi:hypothetical protein
VILGWLFITSLSWVFLTPIFFLLWSFFESILKNMTGLGEVREEVQKGVIESIQDIANRTGMPEEKVRRHVVHEKRSGDSDIWFNPSTTRKASIPFTPDQQSPSTYGC